MQVLWENMSSGQRIRCALSWMSFTASAAIGIVACFKESWHFGGAAIILCVFAAVMHPNN